METKYILEFSVPMEDGITTGEYEPLTKKEVVDEIARIAEFSIDGRLILPSFKVRYAT